MKNILITTMFEADTLSALRIAADLKRHTGGSVVLLTVSELSDSITDLLFLSSRNHIDQHRRQQCMEKWKLFKNENKVSFELFELKEHHQFGLSRPILKQILERFEIDMIIVPQSVKQSQESVHHRLIKLLQSSQYPLMLLSGEHPLSESIQRALFLDGRGESLAAEIENMPFHIIHKSMIEPQQQPLKQLIDRHKIDLIVQRKQNGEHPYSDKDVLALGLPVLTV